MSSNYYQSMNSFCDNWRVNPYNGKKFRCKNSYLNSDTHLCQACTPKTPIEFVSETEELEFLRGHVARLIRSQGRTTVNDSMSLDYAWDMLEEYVENNLHSDEY